MKSSRRSSPRKTRQEIEKDVSEEKLYDKKDVFPQSFHFPFFMPGIHLIDFDQNENHQDNIHIVNKSGDVPVENNESQIEIESKI